MAAAPTAASIVDGIDASGPPTVHIRVPRRFWHIAFATVAGASALYSQHRSDCPISLTLETLGDKWSLLIIRDLMFSDRRCFRQFLSQSEEGIVSNTLADRLKRLVDMKIIVRTDDPTHKQKGIYSLTEKAILLVPLLAAIGIWSSRNLPLGEKQGMRMAVLERGGAKMCRRIMQELRESHLRAAARPGRIPLVVYNWHKTADAAMLRKRKWLKRAVTSR